MADQTRPSRGRPRSSSRELLEDAAFELFLENGYVGTTIEHITQRAGISRNTFFNYFQSKSDVFWGDVDASFHALTTCLAGQPRDLPLMVAIHDGLISVASGFGPSRVPWILTQYRLIGNVSELQASAFARFAQWAGILSTFAAVRLGVDPSSMVPQSIAYALTGAIVAAAQEWAAAGPSRGELAPYVETATHPICAGFQQDLDR